jgi:urocanate hydratase
MYLLKGKDTCMIRHCKVKEYFDDMTCGAQRILKFPNSHIPTFTNSHILKFPNSFVFLLTEYLHLSFDMNETEIFQQAILQGIPEVLPNPKPYDPTINHAPKRKEILTPNERKLALRNALRYFKPEHHATLIAEFDRELTDYGRIYMYRLRPDYPIHARHIDHFPHQSRQAAAIMLMLSNNLDYAVAQHPHELITYGGNGAVFQNWAQYLLTMQYLATMTDEQTLVLYSGHPMGLFPSHKDAPRVVVTNGMMIPNYSKPDDWERFNALGVTQYGQMTAGSFMYIGPQGIVHGTTITVMNAARMIKEEAGKETMKLLITAGLGGMSGAQPKAANIAGVVSITAEINPKAAYKRHEQGWVDEVIEDADQAIDRALSFIQQKEIHSIAYLGNIVDLWERLAERNIKVDLGTDQTSLHNPFAGGYYPAGLSYDESVHLMANNPDHFKQEVYSSLRRHVAAINTLTSKGMYFFDYGNAFLLESGRAGADIMKDDGTFRYPSYVQDIMGPMCFDFGFGPFRWVCTSGDPADLEKSDNIAMQVLEGLAAEAPAEIMQQLNDNIRWIREAKANKLVVGSQARILYADAEGRTKIAEAFNHAVRDGHITAPVVLGRDHHDVSGTDSPYRETSNIYDGSQFTADMAIHNVIGDAFRGATWVSVHNGGGVGWGEVINGGFGMVLDGTPDADRRLKMMLFWDVNNGIARRSWARNHGAIFAIKRAMAANPDLKVTIPHIVADSVIDSLA